MTSLVEAPQASLPRRCDRVRHLAVLGTAFTRNILADERDWHLVLADADLEGLPGFLLEGARAAAEERGLEGHAITASRSLITPFLEFSPRRDLRKTVWQAWTARGANGGETDNREIATEILALRKERAAQEARPGSQRPGE